MTTELGKQVAINAIDKELKKLWELDDTNTKASLINFAIYSEKGNSLIENSRSVQGITQEHACRAILIDFVRSCNEREVKAWVTAHCHLVGGKQAACSEQISLQLSGTSRGRLRHTLFSNLLSDLPVILWWQGELSSAFEERFYSQIDRLVVDSAEWANHQESFATLSEAFAQKPSLVVQDLSWTRTFHFRVALANMFDNPIAQAALPTTKQVKITTHPSKRASALMMVAWIHELSGWVTQADLVTDPGDHFCFSRKDGGEVTFSIEYKEDVQDLNEIIFDMGETTVHIKREQDKSLLHNKITHSGEALIDMHSPADSLDSCELVNDQLSRGGKNSLFKRILPAFMNIIS